MDPGRNPGVDPGGNPEWIRAGIPGWIRAGIPGWIRAGIRNGSGRESRGGSEWESRDESTWECVGIPERIHPRGPSLGSVCNLIRKVTGIPPLISFEAVLCFLLFTLGSKP
ncbi:hypothetical protein HGM15179_017011 [Zosterops borbonicus]|uniref:Uncharacterized protein n=1 Tax=Zosterops borbonicus TaxID=364589 RepID=A0A8K1LDR7_9PASS|nr:hypothetical protein HGM15179_017011 [Zosterops borbonicus]